MQRSELLSLLDRLELHPSRRLGQNFLVDENCLQALVRSAHPQPGEAVLEIGPGTGVLTEKLLDAGCQVFAVEYDHRLFAYLKERFASRGEQFTLVNADACRVDYQALLPQGRPFRVIANLPYSCASVLLGRLSELDVPPESFHILLQLEMAQRLTAPVGSGEYGVLTARLAFRYAASIVRTVPKGVFFPPPEIDSAFLQLEKRKETPPADVIALASRLAGAAFSSRRKQARRLLESQCAGFDFAKAFAGLSLSPEARAEVISPAQYLALARMVIASPACRQAGK